MSDINNELNQINENEEVNNEENLGSGELNGEEPNEFGSSNNIDISEPTGINIYQVVHNIKNAYVEATGDTDDITYGNIDIKVGEAATGGGSLIQGIGLENEVYTITDNKGDEHQIEVTYDNGRIVAATYDDEPVNIKYDNSGNLIQFGDIDIDVSEYPGIDIKTIIGYILNDDKSVDIDYDDGTSVKMVPTYKDDAITSVSVDGSTYKVTYDNNGKLIKIGGTDIDVSEYVGTDIETISAATLNVDKSINVAYADGGSDVVIPTFDGNVITSVSVGGVNEKITYDDNGYIVKIGNMNVSGMGNYPAPSTQEDGSPLHPYGFELGQTAVEFYSITESE